MSSRLNCLCAAVCLLLCSGCSKPQSFSIGQSIGLGGYTISVKYPEVREQNNQRMLLVHFRCEQTSSAETADRFQGRYLTAFSVTDGKGRRYVGAPIIASGYRFAAMSPPRSVREAKAIYDSMGDVPDFHEWIVMVPVKPDATGFTLSVHNMDRQANQPGVARVALGR